MLVWVALWGSPSVGNLVSGALVAAFVLTVFPGGPDRTADEHSSRVRLLAPFHFLGRFFVELVTDGAGYNATSVEFRITRWLALLGTVSTIGDESLNLKVSKDY